MLAALNSMELLAEESAPAPAVFIGHGSPMNGIQNNRYTRGWSEFGESLPRPSAIVSISAHWVTRGTHFTAAENPKTIHDMYGFPEPLYDVQYPAPGAGDLESSLLDVAGASTDWGLDHGTWVVLKHMYPDADIPVVQLSIDRDLMRVADHFELAQQLRSLRSRNVLILGTGNLVHNLQLLKRGAEPYDWAIEFEHHLVERLRDRDFEAALTLDGVRRIVRLAHPTMEHYLPLIYVLGVSDPDEPQQWFNEGVEVGTMSMACVRFG